MGSRKTLTIGVTINLDNYENLRLEVSGEVDSGEDAEDLTQFLHDILGDFGRGDPATAGRVESYRKRVLPDRTPAAGMKTPETGQGHTPCQERPAATMVELPGATASAKPLPVTTVTSAEEIAPATGTLREIPAIPDAASADPGNPVAARACEVCSASVSAAEQKMSQLFTGKTLCRACMKNL